MSNCPGPVDANGCETPMNCVMVDWAAGEQCPPPAEAAAESCMPWSPVDCGEGMKSCPGNFDHRACPMPDMELSRERSPSLSKFSFRTRRHLLTFRFFTTARYRQFSTRSRKIRQEFCECRGEKIQDTF